jgi:hypothetical protein
MNCIKCGDIIPEGRLKALPTAKTCVNCSTEEKKAVIQINNHKTGNEIQIVDQKTAREFNLLASRSSFGVSTGVKGRR